MTAESLRLAKAAASIVGLPPVGELDPALAVRVDALRRKAGRPSVGADGRLHVRLTPAQRATASILGHGNANAGVRLALDMAAALTAPGVEIMIATAD